MSIPMPYITCRACGASNVLTAGVRDCHRCGEPLSLLANPDSAAEEGIITEARTARGPAPMLEAEDQDDNEYRPVRRRRDSSEFEKARTQAVRLLFAIAALQMICGLILIPMADKIPQFQGQDTTILVVIIGVTIFVYGGLGLWAMYSPWPPPFLDW